MTRRVVLTGAGCVSPLGAGAAATIAALRAGRVAIGPLQGLTDLDRLSVRIGAQVADPAPEAAFGPRLQPLLDRATALALASADEAVAAAGLTPAELAAGGVVMGTAGGGHGTADAAYREVYQAGKARVHPFTVPRLMHNAAASHIAMRHGLTGPAFTVSTACASSNHAIGLAFQQVRAGIAPLMLAGGAEAMLNFGGIKAWEGLRVLSPDGCRPFCATRNGMVMGEGAAVFVLEDRGHAIARGAPILAEVAGFAMSADAGTGGGDIVLPSAEGAARCLRAALADAGAHPAEVGYVNAHGTGTAANDRAEAAAIRAVLGEGTSVPVSATKSMHGHLIGAAGAVELLACLSALQGVLPPTMGHRAQDADIGLDIVPGVARAATPGLVLSNAFAFGGLNAILVLRAA